VPKRACLEKVIFTGPFNSPSFFTQSKSIPTEVTSYCGVTTKTFEPERIRRVAKSKRAKSNVTFTSKPPSFPSDSKTLRSTSTRLPSTNRATAN
jgi:hypothetical protein